MRVRPARLRLPTIAMSVVSLALGAGMLLQPDRFGNTPSYANLINIAPIRWWGLAYLLAAVLLTTYLPRARAVRYGIAVHTLVVTLYAIWLVAFVVRWATDDGTTIVNVASWSLMLYTVSRSAAHLDSPPEA